MVNGFDFCIDTSGELVLDDETYDIKKMTDNELRLQLAYDRIKSISNNWYKDRIGADLESLIGRPCDKNYAEVGKQLITNQLIFDKLWNLNEFYIRAIIKSDMCLEYNIFFKIKDQSTEDTSSYEIDAVLDLVKGVNIRYGWDRNFLKQLRQVISPNTLTYDIDILTTIKNNTESLYEAIDTYMRYKATSTALEELKESLETDLHNINVLQTQIVDKKRFKLLYEDVTKHYMEVTAIELNDLVKVLKEANR